MVHKWRQGVTITLKGPRQVGKSSLLMRIVDEAIKLGKTAIDLDFQSLDQATLKDANTFFYQFCLWLTDELGLEDRLSRAKF